MSIATTPPLANNNSTAVAAQRREIRVVEDHGPLANLFDTARFEHMYRIARTMALGSLTPKHLKANDLDATIANCFRVCNQAVRWGMDPFAVVDETYVVHGKLGYQGKLVTAVVNARADIVRRLNFTFTGKGNERTVTVSGQFNGEAEPRTIELSVAQARTDNDMWTKDPDQKLCYSGATKWARRHCPEILLGVLTEDDLEQIRMANTIDADPSPEIRSIDDLTDRELAKRSAETIKGEIAEITAQSQTAEPSKQPEGVDQPKDAIDPTVSDDGFGRQASARRLAHREQVAANGRWPDEGNNRRPGSSARSSGV